MRVFWGLFLGLALFFPGIVLVRWLGQDVLGYTEMSVTDGCLVMIIILLSVIIVTGVHRRAEPQQSSRRQPAAPGAELQPYPHPEPQRGVRRPRSRRPSQSRTQR